MIVLASTLSDPGKPVPPKDIDFDAPPGYVLAAVKPRKGAKEEGAVWETLVSFRDACMRRHPEAALSIQDLIDHGHPWLLGAIPISHVARSCVIQPWLWAYCYGRWKTHKREAIPAPAHGFGLWHSYVPADIAIRAVRRLLPRHVENCRTTWVLGGAEAVMAYTESLGPLGY